jgi:hypothetical protein
MTLADTTPIWVALIGSFGLVLVAVMPFLVASATRMKRVDKAVNNVSVKPEAGEVLTLGQVVVEGFAQGAVATARNHDAIRALGRQVDGLDARLSALEDQNREQKGDT